jgi:gluconolactonase
MKKLIWISMVFFAAMLVACGESQKKDVTTTIGSIERLDPEINQVIPEDAVIEVLAEGFDWSEGPVWISTGNYLLFSDIPPNRIYKWSEEDSIELYLEPSGYTGELSRGGEEGSNGLLLDPSGALVLCQHGDRRMAKMETPLSEPQPVFSTIVDNYNGKRLNSPNDACYDSKGNLYFTDPPYGLPENENDPAKELEYQGVFMMRPNGSIQLLTSELSRPNGIALSPSEKILYVANSDPENAIWMSYNVLPDGTLINGRVFYDVTDKVGEEKGLPDGMKVNRKGYIFATGPGGVLIFSPLGIHLGTIKTTEATANCTFDDSENVLYITADMYLLRVVLTNLSS